MNQQQAGSPLDIVLVVAYGDAMPTLAALAASGLYCATHRRKVGKTSGTTPSSAHHGKLSGLQRHSGSRA